MSPNGKFLFASNLFSNTISPFSINADGSLSPISCPGSNCNAGSQPHGLALTANGRFLYSVSQPSSSISPFSINADGSLTPISCPGSNCGDAGSGSALAASPNSRFLYAANSGSNTVSPFSINNDGSLTPISCSGSSCNTNSEPLLFSIAVSPDQAPTSVLAAAPAPAGQPSRFNGSASSATPGQSVARYDWSFGDGTSAQNAGPTPAHTYAVPGNYTVSLTVTDDAGCSTEQTFTGQTVRATAHRGHSTAPRSRSHRRPPLTSRSSRT